MTFYKAIIALLATTALAFPRHIRRQDDTCDLAGLSNIALPTSTLPSPSGLTLSSIVIGRGVQNYTCANATATPAAIGAVAILYDASCTAIDNTAVFDTLATTALSLDLPGDANADLVCGQTPLKRSGHHFFNSGKVPVFDFSESAGGALGVGLMGVLNRTPAPNTADVAWLELGFVAGTQGPIQAIYRVQTRGGQPPATCEGVEGGQLSSQYSAEYWIFTGPTEEEQTPSSSATSTPPVATSGTSTSTPTTATSGVPSPTRTPGSPPGRPGPPFGSPPRPGFPGGPGRPPLPTRPVGGVITRPGNRPRGGH